MFCFVFRITVWWIINAIRENEVFIADLKAPFRNQKALIKTHQSLKYQSSGLSMPVLTVDYQRPSSWEGFVFMEVKASCPKKKELTAQPIDSTICIQGAPCIPPVMHGSCFPYFNKHLNKQISLRHWTQLNEFSLSSYHNISPTPAAGKANFWRRILKK